MFTGIIEGVGKIREVKKVDDWTEVEVEVGFDLETSNIGESISINGCCTTLTSRLGKSFWATLSPETLAKTTLDDLKAGDPVNLERALKVGSRIGGHFVQGHIDGVGKVLKINKLDQGVEFVIENPSQLSRYMVDKGSIAVDGVSLTINHCEQDSFSVMVIPHTKLMTTFSKLEIGSRVNLEVDVIGKYVEKLTHLDSEQLKAGSQITTEFLKQHGF
jgi:riboflavin synthase